LQDFLPLLTKPRLEADGECLHLYREVTRAARPGGLDDDFTLVVLSFA
jgi:hypothetical protein